jgi:Fur family ferric uptake transcriptional regulator
VTHDQLRWEEALWNAGYRVTRQRSLIIDAVCAGEGHTSFGDIYTRVRMVDRTIDRSTIYRALHLFTELGLVVSADTGGEESYYEVAKPQPHHHLVCRACGQQWEIGDEALAAMFAAVEDRYGFAVATDHLVLFGTCAGCRAVVP